MNSRWGLLILSSEIICTYDLSKVASFCVGHKRGRFIIDQGEVSGVDGGVSEPNFWVLADDPQGAAGSRTARLLVHFFMKGGKVAAQRRHIHGVRCRGM